MKSKDAEKILSQIDIAVTEINSFTTASNSEKSYLAKFLVVFISGIYEESVETIINEMVHKLGKPEVSTFVENSIHISFRNPNMNKIKELLSKFGNISWIQAIDSLPQDTKDAFDSICSNKNALAHGNPVTITLIDVLDYYSKSRVVIEKIDELLL